MFKWRGSKIKPSEPRHDKTNKMAVRPAKTQIRPVWSESLLCAQWVTRISLGIRPIWSESSLSTWRKLGSLATHWVHSEDSDQTGRMPRLIWVFTGRMKKAWVLSYPLSAQWRLWSDWADAQADLSLHWAHEESLGPELPTECTVKTLIRLDRCPGLSESSLGAHSICWFCHVVAHLLFCFSRFSAI